MCVQFLAKRGINSVTPDLKALCIFVSGYLIAWLRARIRERKARSARLAVLTQEARFWQRV